MGVEGFQELDTLNASFGQYFVGKVEQTERAGGVVRCGLRMSREKEIRSKGGGDVVRAWAGGFLFFLRGLFLGSRHVRHPSRVFVEKGSIY